MNRIFLPTHIGVGEVNMNGRKSGVLRLIGRCSGETEEMSLDVILSPSALAQTVAAADELRTSLRS